MYFTRIKDWSTVSWNHAFVRQTQEADFDQKEPLPALYLEYIFFTGCILKL